MINFLTQDCCHGILQALRRLISIEVSQGAVSIAELRDEASLSSVICRELSVAAPLTGADCEPASKFDPFRCAIVTPAQSEISKFLEPVASRLVGSEFHADQGSNRVLIHRVVPVSHNDDAKVGPWVEPHEFNQGYIQRGLHLMPKRGSKPEWQHSHDYWIDKDRLPANRPDDPALSYA